MNQLPFNYNDFEALCDERVLALGRAYWRQGHVRGIKIEENGYLVTGTVRETQLKPFTVVIRAISSGQLKSGNTKHSVVIESMCSCGVESACKHAVALCLEALDSQKHLRGKSGPTKIVPLTAAFKNVKKPQLEEIVRALPPDMRSTIKKPSSLQRKGALADQWNEEELESKTSIGASKPEKRIAYILDVAEDKWSMSQMTYMVARPVIARLLREGVYSEPRNVILNQLVQGRADYITADDSFIGKMIHGSIYSNREEFRSPPGDPDLLDQIMRRMIATRRCFFRNLETGPLKLGESRTAKLGWRLEADGAQTPTILIDNNPRQYFILPAAHPWYVDARLQEAGPLSFDGHLALVQKFLSGPKILPDDVASVAERIQKNSFLNTIISPRSIKLEKRDGVPVVPCLRLVAYSTNKPDWKNVDHAYHLAFLHFEYDGVAVDPKNTSDIVAREAGDRLISMARDPSAESKFIEYLTETAGLVLSPVRPPDMAVESTGYTFSQNYSARMKWFDFLNHEVPKLRATGWHVDVEDGFANRFTVIEVDNDDKAWEMDLKDQEGGAWWFSLNLGIMVEGQRVALLPLLMQSLKRLREPTKEAIESLALSGKIYVDLPDGRALALPFARVRDILTVLVELYDQPLKNDGSMDVSIDLVTALSGIESATKMRWLGGTRLRALIERLKNFEGINEIAPPAGLIGTLRPYQREGLSWLQFLRDYDLGGILADDMGLGKTIQTLAHILIEKEAGRLENPCLIICPTSLIPNWQDEAAKFAPGIRVLSLHGKNREARFREIERADLVFTTYPLLTRDAGALLPVKWHMVVLDEAQAIKNPTSQATQLVCKIETRHRLCLTGTPIENHLGELWSHFAFLMPGMLGSYKDFNKRFRTPIEKHKDLEQQALLAMRLKPFILRRNKANVAKELPPKTEIIHHVEFDSVQRDLYETVRLTMHEKVQEAVKSKGFNKSRIVILDALLKLRQVCCDPRLVNLTAAQKVKQSAKLESLMDMLPEMVEEGRRILLFSQFTSMLDLIKPELEKAEIPFVEIRGSTLDRKTPVTEFQKKKIPLFLISLKAGGTGLNLTAADTVIHYDPWWNPAVENQATDRAHRIGQDKPVFVYKFIVRETVEERILQLQERKRGFAAAIMEERSDAIAAFEPNDLDFLFQKEPSRQIK